MKQQLTNPYWAVLLIPLAVFLALIYFRADVDSISLIARVYTFLILAYVGSRYVGRAPILIWQKNMSPEARNVIGWGIAVVGFLLQIAYGWIYIAYDRPLALSSQYWGASFVVLIAVGLTVVASSVPRLPPFGDGRNGLSEAASALVVIVSALGVLIASHIPQAMALMRSFWGSLVHTL